MAMLLTFAQTQARVAVHEAAVKAEMERQNIYSNEELDALRNIGFTDEQINALPVPLGKSHCDWPYFDKKTKTWATSST